MLTGGEFMAISQGNDPVEVEGRPLFMTSSEYANARAAAGHRGSRRTPGSTSTSIPNEQDQAFAELLLSSRRVPLRRFGLMPGAVGSGTFWKETIAWIIGESTDDDSRQHRGSLAEVLIGF